MQMESHTFGKWDYAVFGVMVAVSYIEGRFKSRVLSLILMGASCVENGGLKAVIWTDVLQYIIMFAGVLAVIIKATIEVGGVQEIWNRVLSGGRLVFIFDLDPTIRHTVWNLGVARVFVGMGLLFQPAYLQRIAATKSLTEARRAVLVGLFCSPIFGILCVLIGLVAYGYYDYKRCDPISSNQIDNINQVLPFLTLDIFRNLPGMSGLFLASLYSASLSSLSSGLSAFANITWEEFIYSANAVIAGPMVSLFYLGAMFPFVNTRSAIFALLVGVSFLTWLVVGASVSPGVRQTPPLPPAPTDHCPSVNLTTEVPITTPNSPDDDPHQYTGYLELLSIRSGLDAFYSLSYTLYYVFGFLIVQVVGVALSLATGGNKDGVNPIYVRKFCWRRELEEEYMVTGRRLTHTSDATIEGRSSSRDGQQTESFIRS
ncbi:sodium-coupled monocarboxylate transporter 2-like [Haliotis rubra]|uniref:sodium-coupled monocarboxylate transporter 2-like n=1 Tax=Haliotis rubra TaxID=36100 RepID=UPI001EE513A3|nr:sodium-coupled monocarboxylate transporter 2-like [Haliotis rubra]